MPCRSPCFYSTTCLCNYSCVVCRFLILSPPIHPHVPWYFITYDKLIAEIHMLMGTPAKAAPEAGQNMELAQAPAQPAAPATEIHAL